jgi:hypothetical protein
VTHLYPDDPAYVSKWVDIIREFEQHSTLIKAFRLLFALSVIASGISLWFMLIAPNVVPALAILSLFLLFAWKTTAYFVARKYLRCPRCHRPNTHFISQALSESTKGPFRIRGAKGIAGGPQQCFWCSLTVRFPDETPNTTVERGGPPAARPSP